MDNADDTNHSSSVQVLINEIFLKKIIKGK